MHFLHVESGIIKLPILLVSVRWSEGSIVRRVIGPKGHWSETGM